jgi:hypothetical protein
VNVADFLEKSKKPPQKRQKRHFLRKKKIRKKFQRGRLPR